MKADNESKLWEWVKAICTVLLVGVVVLKVYETPVDLTIDFPTLLSLLLALFSVGLASLFYFKATDTSNTFYDNTYKFTKDIAELLIKIESGFGERLRHLDEGYTSMRDYLQNTPVAQPQNTSVEETKTKIDSEKQEIEKMLKERMEIISQLVERSQLQQEEKEKVLGSLQEKEEELAKAQSDLEKMNRRLVMERMRRNRERSRHSGFDRFSRSHIVEKLGIDVLQESPNFIRHKFREIGKDLPLAYINDLKAEGYISEGLNLTPSGIEYFRSLVDEPDA